MNSGTGFIYVYRVCPRYTSSEGPRRVNYNTALSWAQAEREAYEAQRADSAAETPEATKLALRGIVEAHKYYDDKIEYQDLLTDERGVRDNPESQRRTLLTEKNESIIENALRVAADRYRESAREFQPDLAPSSPLQATKTYAEDDIHEFLGWMCVDLSGLHEVPMRTFIEAWERWTATRATKPNPRLAEQFLKQEQEARTLADAMADVGLLIENK